MFGQAKIPLNFYGKMERDVFILPQGWASLPQSWAQHLAVDALS
jgi:hypothetical protein